MVSTTSARRCLSLLLAVVCISGCGGDETGESSSSTSGPEVDEACVAGEMPLEGGGCQPAGVPPELCGAGFEPDGAMGCNAILPVEPCPSGQMAIPGDVACRPVGPCPDGPWGDIPVDATTEFVDGAYAGVDSDGTEARPWTSIQAAMDAADPGAIVAIAAGVYHEWVDLRFKAVRLWGRCASMVELVGDSTGYATIFLEDGIAGTEVRDLAVTGPEVGISLSGSENVLVDRVWIHDMGSRAINVQNDWGPTALTVTRSLIERTEDLAVHISASRLVLEDSVVRDTAPIAGNFGRGINAQILPASGERANLTVRGSLLERHHEAAVYVAASDATIERTVIRDTLPQASDDLFGRGLVVEDEVQTGQGSTLELTASVVERSLEIGVVVVRSQATIEATVVRDTFPAVGNQRGGRGIEFDPFDGVGPQATVRWSLIDRSTDVGLAMLGTAAILEGVRVRDVGPNAVTNDYGYGIVLQQQGPAPPASVRWCVVERSREAGICFMDHDGTIEGSAAIDTQSREKDGTFGDGIAVSALETPRAVTVKGSLVERSARSGVAAFGSQISLLGTSVDCNSIDLSNEVTAQPGTFTDMGGNRCGCGDETRACQAKSSGIAPPQVPSPAQ